MRVLEQSLANMMTSLSSVSANYLLLLLLLFLSPYLTYSLKITDEPNNNINNNNNSTKITNLQLSQSAPYTIFDKNKVAESAEGKEEKLNNKTQVSRNVLFRLTNGTQLRELGLPSISGSDEAAWILIGPNGTIVGHKLNLNIEKLVENLRNNNFTSEIRVDREDPTRIVNITISGQASANDLQPGHANHLAADFSSLDELLLEELIMDAMPNHGTNLMPVYRDNHRFDKGNNRTLRPKPPPQLVDRGDTLVTMITPPPIRAAMEVIAENYTIRKVSEEANVFSLKLLHQVNLEKLGSRNLIQAPFAIYEGLGLLLTGAQGDTAKELDKVLLGVQSSYENQKLTHDQDRNRLMASFSDVLRQLHSSATNHLRTATSSSGSAQSSSGGDLLLDAPIIMKNCNEASNGYASNVGPSSDQHLILANNLLFTSNAYEISQEFKQYIASYFNQTALTKIEIGSTESIQTINGWIRRETCGLVASIIDKKNTFDETNVMSLLSTAWLQQEWRDYFYKVASPTRSGIRLKLGPNGRSFGDDRANLLEFVDDNKQSHFVEYIKSEPSKNIHVYRSTLSNGQPVELVTVPFRDSNHRLITITPIANPPPTTNTSLSLLQQQQQQLLSLQQSSASDSSGATSSGSQSQPPIETLPDSSSLSRLIAFMSNNPRKVMRSIWNIIAPDIITKQTLQTIQQARQKNITIDEQLVGANVIPLVQLSIPILRSGSDSSLSAALNHIGVVNTFDPYQANFIGINGHPFNYYKLHLSNVIFKTTFNMNERGINYDRTIKTLESMRIHSSDISKQRQQSTSKGDKKSSEDENTLKMEFVDDVKLNKPFVYMICDMRTKLILYAGTLRNPAQES